MIHVRLCAAPLVDGVALLAPPETLRELRDVGYLLARATAAVSLDVLVAAPLPPDEINAQALPVLRRAVSAAAVSEIPAPVGPRGRWYAALALWGWLTVLFADQLPANVLGGLWLGVGMPWVRRHVRRGAIEWAQRGAAGWAAAAWPERAKQRDHAGLARLAALIRESPGTATEKYREAAGQCASLGAPALAGLYAALAAGAAPPGVWTWLATPANVEAAGHPSEAETEAERTRAAPEVVATSTEADGSAPSSVAGASERTSSIQS